MSTETDNRIPSKYSARFGQVAVQMGFVSEARLIQALCIQVDDNLTGREHRPIGKIMFENDWMTSEQIETVLDVVLKKA